MTPIHDVVRAVAALSPQGQWVTVKSVAGALHERLADIAAAVAAAAKQHQLESQEDDWGISRTRTPGRPTAARTTMTIGDVRPPPPPRRRLERDRP